MEVFGEVVKVKIKAFSKKGSFTVGEVGYYKGAVENEGLKEGFG